MRSLLASLALVLLVAWPVHADGCVVGDSTPGTTQWGPHGEVGVFVSGFYIFQDDPTMYEIIAECPPGHSPDCIRFETPGGWIYEESNEIAGLQRDDYMVDDTCGGAVASDALVW